MAFEVEDRFALVTGRGVPELGRVVVAAGEHAPSVGRKVYGRDGGGVPFDGGDRLAGLGVPNLGGVVLAAGDDACAVARNRRTHDAAGMPGESLHQLAGRGVP